MCLGPESSEGALHVSLYYIAGRAFHDGDFGEGSPCVVGRQIELTAAVFSANPAFVARQKNSASRLPGRWCIVGDKEDAAIRELGVLWNWGSVDHEVSVLPK